MLDHILHRHTDAVLLALGVGNLSSHEKVEIMEQIYEHFNKIIIDVAVAELNDEQIKEFSSALNESDAEERITTITAHIPGLMGKIEEAVEQEFFIIRSAKGVVSK